MFDLNQYLDRHKKRIDQMLADRLPAERLRPEILHHAMRYSVLAGGKRIRPILCMASAEAVGGHPKHAVWPALATEVFHTYTLIHDDLPAMDKDDLRRGHPTCHIKFGEANAILAGDALLTLAFEWTAKTEATPPYHPNQFTLELAKAGGHQGVIAGQVEDMAAENNVPDQAAVYFIHTHKTAALIQAACRMGAIAGGASKEALNVLTRYGAHTGLAFQIADDVLNATADSDQLGKSAGSDDTRGKGTYVALMGVDRAREKARSLIDCSIAGLDALNGPTEPLRGLAVLCISRSS